MEVFVEQDKIFPMGILRVPGILAVAWPSAFGILQEQLHQTPLYFIGDLFEISVLS
jgi:hypothetical protein